MKKFLIGFCVCLLTVVSAFILTACEDPVVSISVKNGEIKKEYYVGEEFDSSDTVLIAKTKSNKQYEVALSDPNVEILNFSTSTVANLKSAQIRYKGVYYTLIYNVKLRDLNSYTFHNCSSTYNGEIQAINIEGLLNDGVTCSIVFTQDVTYGTETHHANETFTGVKNAGEYHLKATLSKAGYNSLVSEFTYTIFQKTIDVEFSYAQTKSASNSWKSLSDTYWQSVSYNSEYQLFARFKNVPLSDQDADSLTFLTEADYLANYQTDLPGINYFGGTGVNVGNYKVKCLCANSNYILNMGNNQVFNFTIVKADSNQTGFANIVKTDSNIANSTVDGNVVHGLTTNETGFRNPFDNAKKVQYNSIDTQIVSNGNGTKTATITYTFINYTNVVLSQNYDAGGHAVGEPTIVNN